MCEASELISPTLIFYFFVTQLSSLFVYYHYGAAFFRSRNWSPIDNMKKKKFRKGNPKRSPTHVQGFLVIPKSVLPKRVQPKKKKNYLYLHPFCFMILMHPISSVNPSVTPEKLFTGSRRHALLHNRQESREVNLD